MIERDVHKVIELDPQVVPGYESGNPTEVVVVTLKGAQGGALNTDYGLYARKISGGPAAPYRIGVRQVTFTALSVVGDPGTQGELHFSMDIREDGHQISPAEASSYTLSWTAMSPETAAPISGYVPVEINSWNNLGDLVAPITVPTNEPLGCVFKLSTNFYQTPYVIANPIEVTSELYF